MEDEVQKSNNKKDYPILGINDRKNQTRLEQSFAQDFIANYLSYGSEKELEEIISRINSMGLIHILIERRFKPDYSTYDPHYIIPYVANTKLKDNKILAPFIASENLREQIVWPENRFSTIAMEYLNFIRFLEILVLDIKSVIVPDEKNDAPKLKDIVKRNIDFQLKNNKKENNFLVTFNWEACLQKQKLIVLCFDLSKFELITYDIVFNGNESAIYPLDDKIKKNYISSSDIEKLENEIKKHSKKNHTQRTDFNSFNSICAQIKKFIINYHKGVGNHTDCSICKRRKFQRSKVKDKKTNTQYCPECTKLINVIWDIKKASKKDFKRASVIKSLTKIKSKTKKKTENNAKYYCEHLLKNVTKQIGMSDLVLEKLKKQVDTVFYGEI